MQNSFKIAISIPKESFRKIEKLRNRMGISRSALIDKAIRFWLDSIEREELIKRYEEGYKNKPECIGEIRAMEKAVVEAFQEEGLK